MCKFMDNSNKFRMFAADKKILLLKYKDMSITKLDQLVELVKSQPKKRLVAANANDAHTIEAVNAAVEMGVIDATLVGDPAAIEKVCAELKIDMNKFKIVPETVDVKAAATACDLINNGEGDILMKGLLPTDKYMRAILNKERGLCPPNATLTHVTVIENPSYHKLLIVGDVAVIPAPDLKQKQVILKYLIATGKALGIEKPKAALICAPSKCFRACRHAWMLPLSPRWPTAAKSEVPMSMVRSPSTSPSTRKPPKSRNSRVTWPVTPTVCSSPILRLAMSSTRPAPNSTVPNSALA